MRKFTKVFIAMALVGSMIPFLGGCTSDLPDHVEDLNTRVEHVLGEQISAKEAYKLVDYQLIGTDVAKTAFNYGVKFNGVATLSNGEQAFASLDYSIPSNEFVHLEKRSSEKKVYDVLEKIVQNYSPQSYSITPVTNLVAVNDAFVQNAPTPFKGYNLKDAMVYNLGAPEFNDENHTISFDVKLLMDLGKVKRKAEWGLCIGFDGSVCFGYGIPISANYAQGTFTTIDKYVIKVDEQTYNAMKADSKAVYDAVVEAIKGDNSIQMKADRQLTSMVTYDAADLLQKLNMSKLEQDLER